MANISQQPFPKLDAPFIDDVGNVSRPWYRFLISLWQRTGAGFVVTASTVVIQLSAVTGQLQAYLAQTGEFLGNVAASDLPGGAVQKVVPGASPYIFTCLTAGTLVVFGAQVEWSRDGGATWYLVTLQGGPIPILLNDLVRLTWYNVATPPSVEFFPGAG